MNKNRRGAVLTRHLTKNNAKSSNFNLFKMGNIEQFLNNNSKFFNNNLKFLNNNLQFSKGNSGITLIALVVTIVVLLILAGVSLSLVAGGDGIIDKASTAVDATNVANAQEAVNLFISEKTMGYYSSAYLDNDNTYPDIQSYIVGQIGNGLEYSGYYLTANSVGDIFVHSRAGSSDIITTVSIDSNGNTVSGGETYTVTLNANGGSVDKNSITVRSGSKYGTLPTPTNGDLKFVGWGTSTDATTYIASTSSVDITSDTTLYAIWRENTQSFNAAHPEYHIPTGFQYKKGDVATGYVITDAQNPSSNSGNEFVWIPVANDEAYAKKLGTNNWYIKYGSSGKDTADSLSNTLSNGVQGDVIGGTGTILGTTVSATLANTPEYAVVQKAGGFWVGRYEAGIESTSSADTIANQGWTNQTIVEKAGVQPVRNIMQTEALSLANSWGSGNAEATKATVKWQSGLITGSQWDAMCKFIGWTNISDKECSSWGNYYDVASASYEGYRSSGNNNSWSTYGTKSAKSFAIFPTARFVTEAGASTVQKNLYDVAGNVWEWTTEVPKCNVSNRVIRGGGADHFGADTFASSRNGNSSFTTNRHWHIGFRLVLYVE